MDELVTSFNLKGTPGYENRTFVIEGNYLIDQHNNVPKLVNENGNWRELDYNNAKDAEVMYGTLAPVGGGHYSGGTYIYKAEWFSSNEPNFMLVAPIFTGDWVVTETQYKDKKIQLYKLVTVLNVGGAIRVVELAWDSPDVTPEHYAIVKCEVYDKQKAELLMSDRSSDFAAFDLKHALPALRVGGAVGVHVWGDTRLPQDKLNIYDSETPQLNDEQHVLMISLFNTDPDSYSLSAKDYAALRDKGQWPDRIVTLALDDGLTMSGDSLDTCLGSFKWVRITATTNKN